jgi:hypothetical protein
MMTLLTAAAAPAAVPAGHVIAPLRLADATLAALLRPGDVVDVCGGRRGSQAGCCRGGECPSRYRSCSTGRSGKPRSGWCPRTCRRRGPDCNDSRPGRRVSDAQHYLAVVTHTHWTDEAPPR